MFHRGLKLFEHFVLLSEYSRRLNVFSNECIVSESVIYLSIQ